jgi:predicted small metal-binding protein
MKQFACGAVVPGCSAVFQAEDEQGIMTQVAQHAREDHGLDEVPADVVQQVRAGIEDVPA